MKALPETSDGLREQLKSSIDIVKGPAILRLRRIAPRAVSGAVPVSSGKTPSSTSIKRAVYKCFGCGAGGDVLKFVMEVDGLTFRRP